MGVLLPPPCPWFQPFCSFLATADLGLHSYQCQRRHVVLLRLAPGKFNPLLPPDFENSSTVFRLALSKCCKQTLWTVLVIAVKDLCKPIGIEKQACSSGKREG